MIVNCRQHPDHETILHCLCLAFSLGYVFSTVTGHPPQALTLHPHYPSNLKLILTHAPPPVPASWLPKPELCKSPPRVPFLTSACGCPYLTASSTRQRPQEPTCQCRSVGSQCPRGRLSRRKGGVSQWINEPLEGQFYTLLRGSQAGSRAHFPS